MGFEPPRRLAHPPDLANAQWRVSPLPAMVLPSIAERHSNYRNEA
jgi:hypothetical protein